MAVSFWIAALLAPRAAALEPSGGADAFVAEVLQRNPTLRARTLRERYKVNVRYPRELRDNVEALRSVLVPIPALLPRRPPTGGAGSASPSAAGPGGAMGSAAMGGPGAGMGGPGMGASALGTVLASLPAGGAGMGGGMAGGGMGSKSGMTSGAAAPAFVPLVDLARIETVMGPPMIKSEMGSLTGWVYVDIAGRDVGGLRG